MAATAQIRQPANQALAPNAARRVVVVHAGARDKYQAALGLAEAGMLECLVTDLFWPAEKSWARALGSRFPHLIRGMLAQRSEAGLPFSKVKLCALRGLSTLLLDRLPRVPLSLRRRMTRHADATLGRVAGSYAAQSAAGLLSYSYYGYDAFKHYSGDGILFQLHPHPASMRRILTEELHSHPECAASLRQEWELALPEEDFKHLVGETRMAKHFLAASSFTRSTLVENGIPREAIRVIPYGVDTRQFSPDQAARSIAAAKLRLLFVGRINQRKGIKYLLDALRLLDTTQVELTICGRVVDDLALFKPFGDQIVVRPNVSVEALVAAYRAADLFVFPSIGEGFGHVLLESLACGLPVLSTTSTAAPDLIESGRQGFVVDPRSPAQLAERIEWALANRGELASMRSEARLLAEQFTWQRFRTHLAAAVGEMLEDHSFVPGSSERKKGRSYVV